MSYLVVQNFNAGLDRRKFRLSLPAGTLWRLINGHITSGGEIEKRKSFVNRSAPVGVFGAQPTSDTIYTFGSDAAPSLPSPFGYFRLQHPAVLNGEAYDASKHAMTKVVSSDLFGAYPFVVAQFSDGYTFCYYCSPSLFAQGYLVVDFTAGVVLPYMAGNNSKIAARFTDLVNATPNYTGSESVSNVDVQALSGSSFVAQAFANSASGILTDSQQSNATAGIAAVAGIGSFAINGGSANAANKITSVSVGATRAYGVLTSDGTNVADGNTVTIDGIVYTFKSVISGVNGQVLIASTASKTLANLVDAINFTGFQGTTYIGIAPHPTVAAVPTVLSNSVTVYAITSGTAGNSITTVESSPHLSWGALTLQNGTSSTSLLSGAVLWVTDDNTTAKAVAANIAANSGTSKYTASSNGNIVQISPVLSNSFENNAPITVVAAGNVIIGNCSILVARATLSSTADVTHLKINGVDIMTATVTWNTDVPTTLAAVVSNINANTPVSGYQSFSVNSTIYLSRTTTTSEDADDTVEIDFSSNGLIGTVENTSSFTAIASPSSASCVKFSSTVWKPSQLVTCLVSGGVAPYKFAWSRVGANSNGFFVSTGNGGVGYSDTSRQQSVTFAFYIATSNGKVGTYQCVVTDSTGATTSVQVQITAK